jgi:hypothetical protein
MTARRISPLVALCAGALAAWPALAQDGLVAPPIDWLWPQLQARITVQTAAMSPLTTTSLLRTDASSARGLQSGGLFGDYTFATQGFGRFRASGGLMLGHLGGAPLGSASAGDRLGVDLLDGGAAATALSDSAAVPYLGVGYSTPALWGGFSLTADVGMVAGRPSGLVGFGRALLGNREMDLALREMRLAPVLQLGVRYEF